MRISHLYYIEEGTCLPPPFLAQHLFGCVMVYSTRPLPRERERERSDNRDVWEVILHEDARMTNVRQPWAHAILNNEKNYENRASALPEAGWVLIIASLGVGTRAEWDEAMTSLRAKIAADGNTSGQQKLQFLTSLDDTEPEDLPRGGIVGAMWVCESCPPLHSSDVERDDGPWRDAHRHAWNISRTIRFDRMIPLKGCQSTYRFYRTHKDAYKDKVLDALLDQLEGHDPFVHLDWD